MSAEAKKRAAELGERPDVQRWIKRLKKLSRDMPEEVFVFCENGVANVMARRPDGQPYETRDESEDPDAVIDFTPAGSGTWDGGGW